MLALFAKGAVQHGLVISFGHLAQPPLPVVSERRKRKMGGMMKVFQRVLSNILKLLTLYSKPMLFYGLFLFLWVAKLFQWIRRCHPAAESVGSSVVPPLWIPRTPPRDDSVLPNICVA